MGTKEGDLSIRPIGYCGGMGVSSIVPERKGLIRCRECYKVYNETVYPMCPFCGTERKGA